MYVHSSFLFLSKENIEIRHGWEDKKLDKFKNVSISTKALSACSLDVHDDLSYVLNSAVIFFIDATRYDYLAQEYRLQLRTPDTSSGVICAMFLLRKCTEKCYQSCNIRSISKYFNYWAQNYAATHHLLIKKLCSHKNEIFAQFAYLCFERREREKREKNYYVLQNYWYEIDTDLIVSHTFTTRLIR